MSSAPAHDPDASSPLAVGEVVLERYRIDAVLGRGAMGVVARATHLALDEPVAIKALRRDVVSEPETRARFRREAQAAARIRSDHVARVHDVATLPDGSPCIVMELLVGVDLRQLLDQCGALAPSLAVDFALQVCEALGEAHAQGIVHRDIKPSNCFVTWHVDGSPLVKVLDFGISKLDGGADLALTQTQSVLGTPLYMSPEQMRSARAVDGRTDLWSLGAVLYELIEGRPPFVADSFPELCVLVATEPPPPMVAAELPAGLPEVVSSCLHKDPAERFQTVAELAAALAPFARDPREAALRVERLQRTQARWQASAGRAVPHGASEPRAAVDSRRFPPTVDLTVDVPRPRGRRRWTRLAGALVAGALVAAIAALGWSARRDPPPARSLRDRVQASDGGVSGDGPSGPADAGAGERAAPGLADVGAEAAGAPGAAATAA